MISSDPAAVLVTGASGFIGRTLCRRLAAEGFRVHAAVRRNPDQLDPSWQWVETGDIGRLVDWATLLEGIDYVVHLAGLAHQIGVRGKGRREEFMRVNTDATRRLAQAAARSTRLRRLLFLSSIGAVASRSDEVVRENTRSDPDTDYGRSKLLAEQAIARELGSGRPDWCVLRPPLVYGPGNPGNMDRLIRLIRLGLPLPLGAIQNRRSFLYVGNLMDAIVLCLTHRGASRRVFPVADSEVVSTPELVRLLGRLSGRSTRLLPVRVGHLLRIAKVGDFASRVIGRSVGIDTYSIDRLSGSLEIDASALRLAVGWKPRRSLASGLAETLGIGGGAAED